MSVRSNLSERALDVWFIFRERIVEIPKMRRICVVAFDTRLRGCACLPRRVPRLINQARNLVVLLVKQVLDT